MFVLIVLAVLPGATLGNGAAPTILVLGDSLSAGYGIDTSRGWTQLLAERLQDNGHPYAVVNASISGDTTRGGLARLPRLLERHQPRIVIIELGGNDGLRGIRLEEMRSNLEGMIAASRTAQADIVLLGMRIPPNYGTAYAERFTQVFAEVARENAIAYVPFFLEGVAQNDAMLQADRIHPSEAAQPVMLANVWPALEPLLAQ